MSGPGAPVSKALLWCGWRVLPIDILLDPTHDLSDATRQALLHEQLQEADCIMAALDCSTKSRARGVPLHFSDGRPSPKPLRSNEHPEGLPGLNPRDEARVERDNKAAGFVLEEIQAMVQRGGATIRENPGRSLHWELPEERRLMDSGQYWETEYSACVFQSARCKYQKLRHNVLEISQWPKALCAHTHASDEWKPWTEHGQRVYPSKEEAEYSAGLAFALAVSLSWWAWASRASCTSDATYGDGGPPGALAGTAPAINAELGNGAIGHPAGSGATTPTGASKDPQPGSGERADP